MASRLVTSGTIAWVGERSEWKGKVTETKGLKFRVVSLTKRLQAALASNRHLPGERVLYSDETPSVTAKVLQKWMAKAQRQVTAT